MESKDTAQKVPRALVFSIFGSIVALVGLYASLILWATWPVSSLSVGSAGTFGDAFGILTSLFSGLAFAGLILTLWQQQEQLKLQQRELEATREEIRLQSKTFAQQRFDDGFFKVLTLYRENLENIATVSFETGHTIVGIEALKQLFKRFIAQCESHKLVTFPADKALQVAFIYEINRAIVRCLHQQSRYLQSLRALIAYVDQNPNESDRGSCWALFTGQLTALEVKYVFYQTLLTDGPNPFVRLARESNLFRDRIEETGAPESHKEVFRLIYGIALGQRRKTRDRVGVPSKELKKAVRALRRGWSTVSG